MNRDIASAVRSLLALGLTVRDCAELFRAHPKAIEVATGIGETPGVHVVPKTFDLLPEDLELAERIKECAGAELALPSALRPTASDPLISTPRARRSPSVMSAEVWIGRATAIAASRSRGRSVPLFRDLGRCARIPARGR